MAHAQKPDFVFRRNGRVHLNRRGRQFSRILAAGVCGSAVVMLYTPCSEVVWRVLATHPIRQFPLHFPSRASPCTITCQLDSNIHKILCFELGYCYFLTHFCCITFIVGFPCSIFGCVIPVVFSNIIRGGFLMSQYTTKFAIYYSKLTTFFGPYLGHFQVTKLCTRGNYAV